MADAKVPTIFSPARRALREKRAVRFQRSRTEPATWLAEAMAEDVLDRLAFMRLEPRQALVVGDRSGKIIARLEQTGCEVVTPDPSGFDEESPIAGGPFDLIVSLARLDAVNDLPGALVHMRKALAEGGVAIAALPGAGSLPAMRRVMLAADGDRPAPRIHPQVDNRAATALLERAGFARQVVDSHTLTLRYGSLHRLVADLREQGLTSALASPAPALGKCAWRRALEAFEELADTDSRVSEKFEILTLTGWQGSPAPPPAWLSGHGRARR